RCISLLQKMYAARSGKNIRFGAPSRRPVIPAKAAANVSAVRSHQNLTAPLVGVPRQGPQSVIRIGGDIRKMWCVAMLRPNSTYIAVTNLVRQGYRSFCPVFQGTTKIVRNRL